jgi:hypothetical protein
MKPVVALPRQFGVAPLHIAPQQSAAVPAVDISQPFDTVPSQFAKPPLHDAIVHAPPEQPPVPCEPPPSVQSSEQVGPHAVVDCVPSQPLVAMPSASHALPVQPPE